MGIKVFMVYPPKDKTKIIPGMFMFPLLIIEGKEVKYVVALSIWDTSFNVTSDNADTEREIKIFFSANTLV